MSKKIKSIVVDTLSAIQQNQYMSEIAKPNHDAWRNYGTDIYKFIIGLQNRGFEIVMILSPGGCGKTYSSRTLEPETNVWYNCDNKQYPTKEGRVLYGSKRKPTKFQVIPKSYKDILNHLDTIKDHFAENRYAFVLGHVDEYKSGRTNRQRLKVLGNLSHKMAIEEKMEHILYGEVEHKDGKSEYYFRTRNNGLDSCRSLEGLFENDKIPNDMQLVLDALENY